MNLFFGGDPGIGRLFGMSMGAEASWLLPAALIGLVVGLWLTRRAARTDRVRAGLLLWGGWLLVTGLVFSFMDGIVHPYYNVALAPAVAALVGIAVAQLLSRRDSLPARLVLATMLLVTGIWSFVLLDRTPDWYPWIRWTVLIGAIVVAPVLATGVHRLGRSAVAAVMVAAALVGLGGPIAFAIYNVTNPSSGPGTMSGPAIAGGFVPGADGKGPDGPPDAQGSPGGPDFGGDNLELQSLVEGVDNRWAAAGIGSMQVSGLELATGSSLMSIGGFTGGDPSPTLAEFQQYVADGQVRYFIASDRGGPPGRQGGTATEIAAWVERNFTKADVGGATVYDLESPRT